MTSPSGKPNHLALWAGITALLTNLAAVNVLVFFSADNMRTQSLAAVLTAALTGATVYARQQLADEKARRDWEEKKIDRRRNRQ